MAYAMKLKYADSNYVITNESPNQCIFVKRGSSLPPSKGLVINVQHLHVPYSSDIFDMFVNKNIFKINIRNTLKLDQMTKSHEILRFDAEIVSIPFVCKKHFSKKYFIEYVNLTSDFVRRIRLVTTPDNKNETLEITVDASKLPKKIKGHKVIKLGEEIVVTIKAIVGDVSKYETKTNLPAYTTPRITKRKFEIPYPIKFAAGVVAFFGVLEVGSALISKVVNKIK